MKFYMVTKWCETESSEGFEYFTNAREAEAAKRDYDHPDSLREATITVIEVRPTKAGILAALRRYGSHNDNG